VTGTGFTMTVAMAPMPAPLVDAVQEIVVETATDMAGVFTVRFGLSPTQAGDWSVLETDPFRPLVPVGIRFSLNGGLPAAVINGFVTAQEASWEEGGHSYLEVRGTDATGLMNLEEKSRAWPNMPDSVIATTIFAEYGLVPQVQPTSPRLIDPEGTTIQRGTDIRFLRRLARRNGFDCFVQAEPLTGIDGGVFGPPTVAGVAGTVLSVAMGSATNVAELRARYDMTRPTSAQAAGIDAMTKAPQPALAPVSVQPPMGLEPALLRLMSGGRQAVVLPADTGAVTTAELQPLVQAIADRSSMAIVIEGRTGPDVGLLRPGQLVALRGAGREFNGLYLLTNVRITAAPGRFEQRFTARRNALTGTGTEAAAAAAGGLG